MNILEENLGIRKCGKKVVGTFHLSVPERTSDYENIDWIWINRIQTHYLLLSILWFSYLNNNVGATSFNKLRHCIPSKWDSNYF